jgi:hypothetical protein
MDVCVGSTSAPDRLPKYLKRSRWPIDVFAVIGLKPNNRSETRSSRHTKPWQTSWIGPPNSREPPYWLPATTNMHKAYGDKGGTNVEQPTAKAPDDLVRELRTLNAAAQDGDVEAISRLQQVLDQEPQLWAYAGNLAQLAEDAWVNLAAGSDSALADTLRQQLATLKAELAGPSPTPLERLLVDRIALCWLYAHYSDLAYAMAKDVTLQQARFLLTRQNDAHNRYLSAIKQLATVRKLLPAGIKPRKDKPEKPSGCTSNESARHGADAGMNPF